MTSITSRSTAAPVGLGEPRGEALQIASVEELPDSPDVAYVAVNRHLTIGIVRDLAARGAGGAVCYATGFIEAADEECMIVVVGCLYWSTSRAKEDLVGLWTQEDANRAVAEHHLQLWRNYSPKPYAGRTSVIQSTELPYARGLGWRAFVQGKIATTRFPGSFLLELRDKQLRDLAAEISD